MSKIILTDDAGNTEEIALPADVTVTIKPPAPPLPVPPKASFTVKMDGLIATIVDTSKPGSAPLKKASYTFAGDGQASSDPGATIQHTFPNASQRNIVQTVTDENGLTATDSQIVYPTQPPATGAPPPPSNPPPANKPPDPPVSPPPPPADPPPSNSPTSPADAFTLQVMDANPDAPDAIVTGTAGGVPVNLTVKPGQCVPLVDGNFKLGAVVYYPDGCIEPENAYVGAGNLKPADLELDLHIVCGDKTWDSGKITVEYRTAPRPFWVVEPTLKDFDRSKFPHYGTVHGSYAAAYAKADNSIMGPGLLNTQMGNEGEHEWLGLLDAWDIPALDNPTPENLAVVLGMSDAANVFPFRARDTATNKMLNAYDYPRASALWACMGIDVAQNPFQKFSTSLPVKRSMDQCTGHAPSFHVAAAAMFQTMRHKAMLSQYTAYLCCWQANWNYRLPNGPTKFAAEEGARGAAWTTRQLAQAAKFSDQPDLFERWLKLRLEELTTVLGKAGPLPVIDPWLVYPTNNATTGWAFAPWQVLDMLGQSLGYCLQLGFTEAQAVFKQLALVRMDSIEGLHELATVYSLTACQNGDRKNGKRAESWGEALQFNAALHPKWGVALTCAEGSQALQDAIGNVAPNNQPGDYIGYPGSSEGYAAIMQAFLAYIVDYYTDDPARALAVWNKFTDKRWYRIKWNDPKYDVWPQKLAA